MTTLTTTTTLKRPLVEPFFNVSEFYASPQLLEENLKSLSEENQTNCSNTTENDGYFKDGKITEIIFNICAKLNLHIEVKYIAIELFDKFMSTHITELYEIVQNSSSKEKQTDWCSVEERIKDQVPLRIITCVQIASKLVSHYKALSPTKVKRFLSSCGLHYSLTSVFKSELRVLRTVDFRLSASSPLTYVQMLLEVFRRNCPGLNANLLHDVCVKLLDAVYMQKFLIYQQLCASIGADFDLKLANDYLLLSTCVIVAASYILDTSSNDLCIEQLSLITGIDEADIILLTTIIVKVVLD